MKLMVDHEDTRDMLISRIDRLSADIVNLWCAKNRLRKKDIIHMLAKIITSRSWLADHQGGEGWDMFDTMVKNFLKAEEKKNPGSTRWSEMSFVERYLGFGIQSVTAKEVAALKKAILDSRLEKNR